MMQSLQNHLLIAMPSLRDPFFSRTVTYLCEHNDDGAMGLIINQPSPITLDELLRQLENRTGEAIPVSAQEIRVFAGGPVSPERGFVLHSSQQGWNSSLDLNSEMMITTSRDILSALGTEAAPQDYLITLGYAGWSAGQLEQELADNSWLTIPADADLVFHTPVDQLWEEAVKRLGIDIWSIAPEAGHA